MQEVQHQLNFKIETPSDEKLKMLFIKDQINFTSRCDGLQPTKHTKRVKKSTKKLARANKNFAKRKAKLRLTSA
jgi:hypothetical protein